MIARTCLVKWSGAAGIALLACSCVAGPTGSTSVEPVGVDAQVGVEAPASSLSKEEADGRVMIEESISVQIAEPPAGKLRVGGEGYAPGQQLILVQCVSNSDQMRFPDVCDMRGEQRIVDIGDGGSFAVELVAHRYIAVGERREVDCAELSCSIGVGDALAVGPSALVPIPEGGLAPGQDAPSLRISAPDYHDDSAPVEIAGAGFTPGSTIRLSQCPTGEAERSVSAADCLYEYGLVVSADDDGEFIGSMVVYRVFQRSSGELVDCSSAPDVCAVAVPFPEEGDRLAMTPM